MKKYLFHIPAALVSLLLLFPFLVFLTRIPRISFPNNVEFLEVIFWTFFQATASTLIVLFLALLSMRGLLALSSKKYYFLLEALVIIPSLLPPLILVVSVANLLETFLPFPFGLTALIFFQVLTYTGLCSVVLSRILKNEICALSEWAYVQGMSSWKFLKTISQTLLKKDIQILAALIFISAFTSLSLPLLTAGGKGISLEFFIYEMLKDPSLWPVAAALILIQTLFVFFIYLKMFSHSFTPSFNSSFSNSNHQIHLLPKKSYLFFSFAPSLLIFSGLFFISDFKKNLEALINLDQLLLSAILASLIVGLGVGCLILLFLIMMSLSYRSWIFRKFVVAYTHPGLTLLGLAFLILPFSNLVGILFKWIMGLSLLLFPFIYRLRGELILEKLKDQVEVAYLLGGNARFIFRWILWPQSRTLFFLCAGIAAFLACGDFAYSLMVSQGQWNLALLTYDLFSSYRLDLALLSSWLLLILSFFILLFWIGVAFVFDKKFKLSN